MSALLFKRLPLIAAVVLSLGACASAPKKSPSEAVALPDHGGVRREGLPNGKRSPYAPAQEDMSKRGNYTRGGLYAPHVKDTVPDHIPDVDAIPEPEVRDEPRSMYGNRSPYTVLGKSYSVLASPTGYAERGLASYYGNKFHGRRTSNLEVYDMYAFTAAHKSLPLPSFARVTNLENGKSVVVRVNDRGPFHDNRLIDLSYAAAVKLGYRSTGTARVEVVGLSPGENARVAYDGIASNAGDVQTTTPPAAIKTAAPATSAMDTLLGALPIASAQAAPTKSATTAALASNQAGSAPSTTVSAPAAATPSAPAPVSSNAEYRFDMRQDGKAMTADEFDAWMASRRVRVATGKNALIARPAAPAQEAAIPTQTATETQGPASAAVVASPAAPSATPGISSSTTETLERITMQIAAFGNQQNANHALAMLQGAGIAEARLLAGQANGQPIWRLRVGPMEAARAPELTARVVGLGFGQPQRVRD